jgi:hypothetical protein
MLKDTYFYKIDEGKMIELVKHFMIILLPAKES